VDLSPEYTRTSTPRPTCSQQQQQQQQLIANESAAKPNAPTFGALPSASIHRRFARPVRGETGATTGISPESESVNTARAISRALDSTADICMCLTYDDCTAQVSAF